MRKHAVLPSCLQEKKKKKKKNKEARINNVQELGLIRGRNGVKLMKLLLLP